MMRSNRALPASVERALNSALSRGPGYEATPIGPAFGAGSVGGYYIDFRAKTTSPTARDLDALPATPLIQLALGWWERLHAGESEAEAQFFRLCEAIERRAVGRVDELRWPINVAVPKYRLAEGWCSALPQGQAASVFVRAYLASGDDRYAGLARKAARPLLTENSSDLVTRTAAGPLLEEAPGDPPSHILNGWISALWGLWDVGLGLDDGDAGDAFQASLSCLLAYLPAYDTGWWSLYSLYPHALEDLAKPIYHRFHITQLDVLHRLTGHDDLRETRDRWARYDRPAARAAAIAHKAAFAAADGWRRRRWERSKMGI
jgi:hypothetical protein